MAEVLPPRKPRGDLILGLNVALLTVTTFVVVLRFYSRAFLLKSWGMDDYVIIPAFCFAVTLVGFEIALVHYGSGSSITTLTSEKLKGFGKLMPIAELIYILTPGAVRLSVLAFLPRLSQERRYIRCLWTLAFIVIADTIVPFFLLLTTCTPIIDRFRIEKPNRHCREKEFEKYVFLGHAVTGILIDLALFSIPAWVIRKNMVFSKKATQAILVFSVAIFAVITGIVRLGVIITFDLDVDFTYDIASVIIWTDIEAHVGIWCCCFPALQPILRLISRRIWPEKYLSNGDSRPTPANKYPEFKDASWRSSTTCYDTQDLENLEDWPVPSRMDDNGGSNTLGHLPDDATGRTRVTSGVDDNVQ